MPTATRIRLVLAAAMLCVSASVTAGCSKQARAVVVPDAPLGRVIIYRNGVAYFERNATVEDELVLDVPGNRVDDFLKSLTVVDTATGKSLPLSYPTANATPGGLVTMRIALPAGRRDVRIAYVTESPSWKPSYRVMLDRTGKARLQSWAVVDNVSNEAWREVAVGVGSTSALSFRYDLHSVQTVERETIDTGVRIASAPPVGGSPYAVDGASVNVLAEVSDEALASLGPGPAPLRPVTVDRSYGIVVAETSGVGSRARRRAAKSGRTAKGRSFSAVVESAAGAANGSAAGVPVGVASRDAAVAVPPPPSLDRVAHGLASSTQRITIEGWAKDGDPDPAEAGLRRANALRDGLVARGIAADRIDVVGHRELGAPDKVVKIVANQDVRPTQAARDEGGDTPRGIAHFMSTAPMTIEAGHSAMVTLFDERTSGERVFLYDPVSERGSKKFAFNAVRVVNPTDSTLDSGPMTVYADGQFLGEGLADPIPPGAAALVPFGLDRMLVATPSSSVREEIESLSKIERGVATTQTQRVRRTVVELANRGRKGAIVYVRHHVASGWTLRNRPARAEAMGNDLVVPVEVGAGESTSLELVESTPITTAIDLRTAAGLDAVAVFLRRDDVDPSLHRELAEIVDAQRGVAEIDETLQTRRSHADALRTRVDELAAQLVALRKVGRAQSLSGHLAKRMRELGDRLDRVGAEIADLETRRLESSIALDNLVADLALVPPTVARQ